MHVSQMYALFLRPDGTDRLSEEQLASHFAYILKSHDKRLFPVGLLTTQRRDHWAESRDLLRKGGLEWFAEIAFECKGPGLKPSGGFVD